MNKLKKIECHEKYCRIFVSMIQIRENILVIGISTSQSQKRENFQIMQIIRNYNLKLCTAMHEITLL